MLVMLLVAVGSAAVGGAFGRQVQMASWGAVFVLFSLVLFLAVYLIAVFAVGAPWIGCIWLCKQIAEKVGLARVDDESRQRQPLNPAGVRASSFETPKHGDLVVRKPRPWQYRLRSLLLVMLLVAVGSTAAGGAWGRQVQILMLALFSLMLFFAGSATVGLAFGITCSWLCKCIAEKAGLARVDDVPREDNGNPRP
jgi:hypothetical protein